jgi:ArsR family transcriptional regulator, arsenate/arsenite/antimonite-responsive transcriptional repressor
MVNGMWTVVSNKATGLIVHLKRLFTANNLRLLTSSVYFDNIRKMEITNAVNQLTALAHETRLAVFRSLVQAGPEGLPAGEIAKLHNMPSPSLSFHLNILNNANMVRATREGRVIRYAPCFGQMNTLLKFLTENCCAGIVCMPAAKLKKERKK